MSQSAENLFVNPLFFEALSGEFTPPSDVQRREHTLGKLAIATFIKGEQKVVDYWATPGFTNTSYIKYSPSWSPNVTVEVVGYLTDNKNLFLLKNMSLENQKGDTLLITNHATNGQPVMSVDGLGIKFDHALELGDQLEAAKNKVKILAQHLFDLEASH